MAGEALTGWLFSSRVNGPALWTGGAFGPDGGLLITPLLALNALLIWRWARARGSTTLFEKELTEN